MRAQTEALFAEINQVKV
jgi:hypothetical protein